MPVLEAIKIIVLESQAPILAPLMKEEPAAVLEELASRLTKIFIWLYSPSVKNVKMEGDCPTSSIPKIIGADTLEHRKKLHQHFAIEQPEKQREAAAQEQRGNKLTENILGLSILPWSMNLRLFLMQWTLMSGMSLTEATKPLVYAVLSWPGTTWSTRLTHFI